MSRETTLMARAAQRTLDGVEAAEGIGAGCAWFFVTGLPVSVGFLVAVFAWPWVGGAIGLAGIGGALVLRQLALTRTRRAAPLLRGFDDVRYPTWSLPVRIPRGTRTENGTKRVWRVLGVQANGRQVVGEVVVQADMGGAWLVVWPVTRPRPQETRSFAMVLEPVLGGYLVSSPDPTSTPEHLRDPMVRELLFELLGEHDELSVYPFAAWWRTRAPIDQAAMRRAEVRLSQLAEVLRARATR